MTIDAPLRFVKGHGTGNDFVVIADPDGHLDLDRELVRAICDRRTGIGGDGLLRVVRTTRVPEGLGFDTEWFMDYRNADGSIAEMCGNGVRVFARYLLREGLAEPGALAVATRAGVRRVLVPAEEDADVVVDMGRPSLAGESVATVAGRPYAGVVVSMGNPHLVCGTSTPVAELDLSAAPQVETAMFPYGVNVEMVNLVGGRDEALPTGADLHVKMRVFERGVGETLSCGTGACAVGAVALRSAGLTSGMVDVDVPGGRLTVTVTDSTLRLAGPAVFVAEGEFEPRWLAAATAGSRVGSTA